MNLLIQYALSFLGLPYSWGGDDSIIGFDCSGLVQEILKSVGMDPPGDQTAQGLYDYFKDRSVMHRVAPGALVFYGKSLTEISHVAFMLDGFRMIEAGGGGSKTTTKEEAIRSNAFIRMRPYRLRPDFLVTLGPKYPFI